VRRAGGDRICLREQRAKKPPGEARPLIEPAGVHRQFTLKRYHQRKPHPPRSAQCVVAIGANALNVDHLGAMRAQRIADARQRLPTVQQSPPELPHARLRYAEQESPDVEPFESLDLQEMLRPAVRQDQRRIALRDLLMRKLPDGLFDAAKAGMKRAGKQGDVHDGIASLRPEPLALSA
jgi:hypothetical protein